LPPKDQVDVFDFVGQHQCPGGRLEVPSYLVQTIAWDNCVGIVHVGFCRTARGSFLCFKRLRYQELVLAICYGITSVNPQKMRSMLVMLLACMSAGTVVLKRAAILVKVSPATTT
jgi:hypothetical protein